MLAMICELYQGTRDHEVSHLSVLFYLKITLTRYHSFHISFKKS
jgi:hypothetical protein